MSITHHYCQTFFYEMKRRCKNNNKKKILPLALIPAPLGNSWQTRHAEVAGLKILSRLLRHNPNKLFVVRFVTFTRAVISHTLGHKLLPVVQLTVADLWKHQTGNFTQVDRSSVQKHHCEQVRLKKGREWDGQSEWKVRTKGQLYWLGFESQLLCHCVKKGVSVSLDAWWLWL